MIYLWLGLTVLLMGNRQQPRDLGRRDRPAARRALLPLPRRAGGRGRARWAFASRMSGGVCPGLPAFVAPFCWAATGLHYADLTGAGGVCARQRSTASPRSVLLAALLAFPAWPAIASYGDFIRLLDASLRLHHAAPPPAARSPRSWRSRFAFVVYVAALRLPAVDLARVDSTAQPAQAQSSRQLPRVEAMARCSGTPPMPGGARARAVAGLALHALHRRGGRADRRADLRSRARRASISPIPVEFSLLPPTAPGHVPLPLVATDLVDAGRRWRALG